MTRHRLTVVFLLIAFGSREIASQDTATPKAFDVASVKSNTSGNAGRMLSPLPGGRFVATNVTLRQLIAFAFGVPNSLFEMIVIGGPDWIDADRFDVEARVSTGDIPRGQSGPLVRALLEERFQLRAHRETRDHPIYQLVVDRADLSKYSSSTPSANSPPIRALSRGLTANRSGITLTSRSNTRENDQ